MSDEDKTMDNCSEGSGQVSSKRSQANNDSNEPLPKRPRMNLWEHQAKTLVPSKKDDGNNVNTEDSGSDDTSSDVDSEEETSLEELAANICCLPGSELIPEELEIFSWLSSQTESFKSVYLYIRNKACMLWLKDPKNQLVEKVLVQSVNTTSSDKYFQDVIAARLCNFQRNIDEENQKNTNRLNNIDRVVLKKYDIDSILKDSLYKDNIHKIAVMTITFLERYGYVNIGNFNKHVDSYTNGSYCGPDGTPLQVVIVGAGLSGIIAALQLQYFGCKVLVLESQEQAGGRLKTYQKNGYQVDISPFSITGINNPVNQLIKQAGLSVSFFHGETDIVSIDGDQVPREAISRVECELNRLLAASKDVSIKFSTTTNLNLGELIESLLALQMSHCRNLKRNSNSLLMKLLSRLQEVIDQLEQHKSDVANAHDKWSHAEQDAKKSKKSDDNSMDNRSGEVITMEVTDDSNNDKEDSTNDNTGATSQHRGSSVLRIINPETQMKINLALSDYRKTFQQCTPSFEEAVKIRKMIKLIHQYDPSSLMLDKQDLQIMNLLLGNLEMRLGAPLTQISAKYNTGSQHCSVDISGGELFIKKGFQALISSMVKRTNAFQFSTIVKEINYSHESIHLTAINTALSEDEPIHYNGHVIVSALPLGILKDSLLDPNAVNSPQFVPPLPDWKIKSIKNLGFGCLDKVVLCFKERFWGTNKNKIFAQLKARSEDRGDFLQFYALSVAASDLMDSASKFGPGGSSGSPANLAGATGLLNTVVGDSSDDDSDTSSQDQDDNNNTNNTAANNGNGSRKCAGIIIGVVCGQAAQMVKDKILSDEEMGKRAMESLRGIFRKKKIAVPEPSFVKVYRWQADVHTRGSVSYMSNDSSISDVINIAAPLPLVSNNNQYNNSTNNAGANDNATTPTTTPRTRRNQQQNTNTATSTSPSNNTTLGSTTGGSQQSTASSTGITTTNSTTAPRLFFCGEHTYRYGIGSIQGAMMSGLRVAMEIAQAYFPHLPNVVSRMPNNLNFRK